MKKFALAAVAAAAMMAGGAANAYTSGTYSNGFVVPNVINEGATGTTAIGIINRSGATVPVYWVFHDQDSGHVADGCFQMTDNQYKGVVWGAANDGADMSGFGLEGQRGYMVFAVGATTTGGNTFTTCANNDPRIAGDAARISANAFQVYPGDRDVAVVPVIDGPLVVRPDTNLTTMDEDSLVQVRGGQQVGSRIGADGVSDAANVTPTFTPRYAVDGATTTRIAVWSTGDQSGSHTVNIYNDAQQRRSVNFVLTREELDWFDPATIIGRPAGFTDGFIEWNVNRGTLGLGADEGGTVFTYSVINATAFGAAQTLLGASH